MAILIITRDSRLDWRGPGQALPGGAIPVGLADLTTQGALTPCEAQVSSFLPGISPGWDISASDYEALAGLFRRGIPREFFERTGILDDWRIHRQWVEDEAGIDLPSQREVWGNGFGPLPVATRSPMPLP